MATKTRRLTGSTACAALLSAIGFAAQSQEPSDASLEVTIRLLPENAVGPAEITRRIELPPAAANSAPPRAEPADEQPGNGRGQDVAAEARERGREFGQDVADQARENRENAGRPDHTGRPDDRGPPPGQPPGPPATPPGQQ